MASLSLSLLGSPDIRLDNQPLAFGNRKAAALLAYLAVTSTAYSRDSLTALFWPDADGSKARASLRQVLWSLHQAGLGAWIETVEETVGLRSGFALDMLEFQALAAQARTHPHPDGSTCADCVVGLTQAAELYRGDFLSGFSLKDSPEFDDWQRFQAEGLRQALSEVLEQLISLLRAAGDLEQAIVYGRRWVLIDPLFEPAQQELIRLYAQSGKRGMALKQYESLCQTLGRELGGEPEEESQSLYQAILERRVQTETVVPGLPRLCRPRHNLPAQINSFIGREKEISAVADLLREYRLVTLHGSGGVGKTRLALKVAEQLLETFDHGVWLVELAPLSDPELVETTVARALGLREESGRPIREVLSAYLQQKNLLMVLDNCEHLVAACARLTQWVVQSAPGVKVLATSREALGINGEVSYRVPSLSLPVHPSLEALEESEAGRLFAERAAESFLGFQVNPSNAGAVAQICTRLDGIAIAIELAACRVRVMDVDQIAVRLSDRFRLLTGGSRTALPRQQTLRATIDWSYSLLAEPERILLRRLAVFAGGWSLEAAEAVCDDENACIDASPVFDHLASLVNKSLALMDISEDGNGHYYLLETVRQYAREKLYDAGEGEALRDRHLAYFAQWIESAESGLKSPDQKLWIQRIDQEIDNLRAALEWGIESNREMGLRLVVAASHYFNLLSRQPEAQRWFSLYLDPPGADYPLELHTKALALAGIISVYLDRDMARQYAQQSIDLARGKIALSPIAYIVLAWIQFFQSPSNASDLLDQAWQLAQEQDDLECQATVMDLRGWDASIKGDYITARLAYQESLALWQSMGDIGRTAYSKHWLGWLEAINGNLTRGREMLDEAMQTIKALWGRHHSSNLGLVAIEQGDFEGARANFIEYTETCREAGFITAGADGLFDQAMVAFYQGDIPQARDLLEEARRELAHPGITENEQMEIRQEIDILYGQMLTWTEAYENAAKVLDTLNLKQDNPYSNEYILSRIELNIRLGRLDQASALLRQFLPGYSTLKGERLLLNRAVEYYAALYACRKKYELAAQLIGAGDAFRRQAGRPHPPVFRPYFEELREQIKNHLDRAVFEAAYHAGQSQTLEAMAEALLILEDDTAPSNVPQE